MLVIFLLSFLFKNEQVISTTEKDYMNYHIRITEIECLVNKLDFSKASSEYTSLLAKSDIFFVRDVYDGILVSCLANNKDNIWALTRKAMENGIDTNFLFSRTLVDSTLGRMHIKDSIKKYYSIFRKTFFSNYDTNLKKAVLRMYVNDLMAKRDFSDNISIKEYKDSWYAIMESNYRKFVSISDTLNRFAGERTLGVDNPWCQGNLREFLRIRQTKFVMPHGYSGVFILLHKNCAMCYSEEKFRNAIIEGELHPHDFAMIYEFSVNQSMENSCKCRDTLKKRYGVWITSRKNVPQMNIWRAEIGLPTIEHRDSIDRVNRIFKVNLNACK